MKTIILIAALFLIGTSSAQVSLSNNPQAVDLFNKFVSEDKAIMASEQPNTFGLLIDNRTLGGFAYSEVSDLTNTLMAPEYAGIQPWQDQFTGLIEIGKPSMVGHYWSGTRYFIQT
jgi:hypothetical protein